MFDPLPPPILSANANEIKNQVQLYQLQRPTRTIQTYLPKGSHRTVANNGAFRARVADAVIIILHIMHIMQMRWYYIAYNNAV